MASVGAGRGIYFLGFRIFACLCTGLSSEDQHPSPWPSTTLPAAKRVLRGESRGSRASCGPFHRAPGFTVTLPRTAPAPGRHRQTRYPRGCV